MDIDVKVKELVDKLADCDKRIEELEFFKKDLSSQLRKWKKVQSQAAKINDQTGNSPEA